MIEFQKQYPPPASFRRPDGSARFAFMTFVMRNDSFVPGALVFAHALRQQRTQADLGRKPLAGNSYLSPC